MLIAIVLFFSFFSIVTSSFLATFSDRKCVASLNSVVGQNGYPNGTCTPLQLSTSESFQVTALDLGCAVTLYGPDTTEDPCSADILILGKIGICYNATWAYYSIDNCNIPSFTPSATPLLISSTLSSTSSPTSTSTSTSTSSTASPSPSPTPEKKNHLPLIIGASIGGVGVVALIAIAALLFLRHRKSNARQPDPPAYELSNDRALIEATAGDKAVKTELWAHNGAHDEVQEMGRNSVHLPPVELEGNSAGGQDKKNINPLIKIHMAR